MLGVKRTEAVQLLLAARVLPQVLVWLKSVRFGPVKLIDVMDALPVPLFVKVKMEPVFDPIGIVPKLKLLGVSTSADVPPPVQPAVDWPRFAACTKHI
jgi:hypothetical protein